MWGALGIYTWICQPHNHSDLTDGEIHPTRTFLEMPIQTINYHLASLLGARTIIDIEETRGFCHLSPHCHPQIVGLKATGVQCWPPHWCHLCQTGQKAPNVPREVDNVGKPEPTWKLIYPSLKMRTQRMLWPIKVGGGHWQYTIVWDAEIAHSSHMPFGPCKATPVN